MTPEEIRASSPSTGELGVIGTGLVGLLGAFLALWRRAGKNSAERHEEVQAGKLLITLQAERDSYMKAAKAAWDQRTADAEAIAGLRAQNQHQEQEIQRLKGEFAAFKRLVVRKFPDAAELFASDFGDLTP